MWESTTIVREIFTGKLEETRCSFRKTKGVILKVKDADGNKRYDFQYTDKYGYANTIGGISACSMRNSGTMQADFGRAAQRNADSGTW